MIERGGVDGQKEMKKKCIKLQCCTMSVLFLIFCVELSFMF